MAKHRKNGTAIHFKLKVDWEAFLDRKALISLIALLCLILAILIRIYV